MHIYDVVCSQTNRRRCTLLVTTSLIAQMLREQAQTITRAKSNETCERPTASKSRMIINLSGSPLKSKPKICYDPWIQQSYVQLPQKYYEAMKACGSLKSLPIARKIHAQLISTCLISSIFLQLIDDDCRVFCDIGPRYLFTCNTMINGGFGVRDRVDGSREIVR